MRFSVSHETRYQYSVPVGFAPHVIRLSPRLDAGTILAQSIEVDPLPAWRDDLLDHYGNPFTRVSFQGHFDHLRIESRFEVVTPIMPPLPLLSLAPLPWPIDYEGEFASYLMADGIEGTVRHFAAELAGACQWDAVSFLYRLTETLFQRTDRHIRVEGLAQSPAYTLASARGACRDLAVLFMAACRSLGIPARFVSGYQAEAESVDGQRHLHAWAEVFIPGWGWIGFDPTHGRPTGDGYVALCAAPDQAATMPVEGGFYANGVTATLDYRVRIATGT
ncbi:MAG: transglutaminase family protein [Zavarzinia sp.]|nr:transglutaminase family protein [Zavarzinia sp.]